MSKTVWVMAISLGMMALQIGAPALASARETVVILGIHSLDGDDELARNITGALRFRARQVDDWQISEREVTFAQMSLAYGCDPPESACLTEIAEALEADHLIFGDVRRTSTGDQYDYALDISFFTRSNGQIPCIQNWSRTRARSGSPKGTLSGSRFGHNFGPKRPPDQLKTVDFILGFMANFENRCFEAACRDESGKWSKMGPETAQKGTQKGTRHGPSRDPG